MKPLPINALRECAARLLAAAVNRIIPEAEIVGGGITDLGFYYDFIFEGPIGEDAFPLIEEQIRALTTEEVLVRSRTMMRENAQEFFKHKNQLLKSISLESFPGEIEMIQINDFFDECPLPHPLTLNGLKALKLLEIEDRSRGELEVTRIVGAVSPDQKQLKQFLKKIKNYVNHQDIGNKKKLFCTIDRVAKDEWFLGPCITGAIDVLKDFWKDFCFEQGFEIISSPSFPSGEEIDCRTLLTAHTAYVETFRRDLPLRIAEFCRHYQPLEEPRLSGLLRTNGCWSDFKNIFCGQSQVLEELISSLHFIDKWNKMLSIEGEWVLASCGKKTKKSSINWKRAETFLTEAFEKSQISKLLRKEPGNWDLEKTSFIGPRLEFHFLDDLGRKWCGPYLGIWTSHLKTSSLNEEVLKDPLWIIGCSIISSVERIVAILLEKGKGQLPLWLLPNQIRIIPLSEKYEDYAKEIEIECLLRGYRVRIDRQNVPLSGKVERMDRDGVGYGLFIGELEQLEHKVSVRSGYDQNEQKLIELTEFFAQLKGR